MANRLYKFKGYYYIDPFADIRLTKNCMISFKAHCVPQYVTFLEKSDNPKEFKSKTKYLDLLTSLKILF